MVKEAYDPNGPLRAILVRLRAVSHAVVLDLGVGHIMVQRWQSVAACDLDVVACPGSSRDTQI